MTGHEAAAAWRLTAVHAGHGPGSASRQLARRLLDAVRDLSPMAVSALPVDVWDLLPAIHRALTTGVWDEDLRLARDTIAASDGVIAVTPIVYGAYSGPFKSFVDVLGELAWRQKPVLIGASGGSARHCLAVEHVLRPLFVCLRCNVLPTSVFVTTDEWGSNRLAPDVRARIGRAATEMVAAIRSRPRAAGQVEAVGPVGQVEAVRGA